VVNKVVVNKVVPNLFMENMLDNNATTANKIKEDVGVIKAIKVIKVIKAIKVVQDKLKILGMNTMCSLELCDNLNLDLVVWKILLAM
jgi:hypothetical protein